MFFLLVGIVIVAAATDAWQLCRNYEAALLQINHATRCQRCGHFVTFNYSRETVRENERGRQRAASSECARLSECPLSVCFCLCGRGKQVGASRRVWQTKLANCQSVCQFINGQLIARNNRTTRASQQNPLCAPVLLFLFSC